MNNNFNLNNVERHEEDEERMRQSERAVDFLFGGGADGDLAQSVDFFFRTSDDEDICSDDGEKCFFSGDCNDGDDVWRGMATDTMAGAIPLSLPADYEPSLALHQDQPAQAEKQPDADSPFTMPMSTVVLPPLPPKPASAELDALKAARLSNARSSGPPAYTPPAVTCWTAMVTESAETTMRLVEEALQSVPGVQVSHNGYTITASGVDNLHVVIYTCVRDGQYVTLCRRLAGDCVTFSRMFTMLLEATNGKPTVCTAASSCHQTTPTLANSIALYQCA